MRQIPCQQHLVDERNRNRLFSSMPKLAMVEIWYFAGGKREIHGR